MKYFFIVKIKFKAMLSVEIYVHSQEVPSLARKVKPMFNLLEQNLQVFCQ